MSKEFRDYEIVDLIGVGGMSAVYRAIQLNLQRPVAIKILPAELAEGIEHNYAARFKNEARAMGQLNHPAIVPIYDFGETGNGLLYLAMELIDGTDVEKLIEFQGRLDPETVREIAITVCQALDHAHRQNIVHRDIKPSNILLAPGNRVVVGDFGLAKFASEGDLSLTMTKKAFGTHFFLPPETLIPGAQIDSRGDLYSLGATLYHML
ncbi:MAG: serine/threonine protein kinase, partial [Verrucomicrobiae bacterium]|nr:serine/threonine protein kinase [Verrucomicrobiae bacterium]